ncbi:hypothetical protein [Cupriavidus oxalaticus]|jgi:hypothetical protein|uniref:DUF2946 domain-containing protein n=1 Tax=Cupriavidus oxalaticus TaxID=96344 RepID=A0A5P3VIW3_9BURK|nr:hypothetical protein [Cupriavidus oxalaticus]QEZ45353.1 hypothetical protein D2917_13435 [Cupriavidus oxalaticus]
MTMATIAAAARRTIPMRTDWFARLRTHGPGLWLALWLALCLLLAQHAGLTHRIVHGGLPATSATSATLAAADGSTDADTDSHPLAQNVSGHSCVLFDGATVADTLCGKLPLPRLAFGKPVKPANLAWRWPDLPAAHPFHSRAPPAPAIALA